MTSSSDQMIWILAIVLIWLLLAVDFLINLDLATHIIFHIIIGLVGTYYIMKNRKRIGKSIKRFIG